MCCWHLRLVNRAACCLLLLLLLQVVPFAVIDQRDFYTMSVRGITHYLDGTSADFASEQGFWRGIVYTSPNEPNQAKRGRAAAQGWHRGM